MQAGNELLLPAGNFAVISPSAPVTVNMSWDYQHVSLRVPRTLVEDVLMHELGCRPVELVEFARLAFPSPDGSCALRRLVETLCLDFTDQQPGLAHGRVAAAMEETLVRLMLATLPHSYSDELERGGQPPPPAPYYVRRAEEYIRAHAVEPITITDLVAAAGVSARSLHSGFRQFRDTSPMSYLKNHRLNLARKALQAAARDGQSVTDVALACGFSHLSKFARDYQSRFGEKPSETRRQAMIG